MSWLRSAISKAAEVGGKNIAPNLSRTVRSVAQHAGQAVAGGAKMVQDRLVGRNLNSAKVAIKRLNEVAKDARGNERVQALARWLAALKELRKDQKSVISVEESGSLDGSESPVSVAHDELPSPRLASKVLFYDFDGDGEPMNFREVFLRSHALENIVTSMITDAPSDEEVNLLLEIFGLCLVGGKELHLAILSSIQDLAKSFSTYTEEFMSKKDYLLQYAESAVQGLKLNADLERLEAETAALMHLIREKQSAGWSEEDGLIRTREILQLHARLRDLLQKKRHLVLFTDTKETRTQKVELLKTLSSSLRQASLEEEKQIAENRKQKEEALKYRTIKAQEVAESEKVVAAEVKVLQQKQDELEAQLKEVKAALAAALKRHLNIQEEKEKFDEASSGVIAHLGAQEEELARSITGQSIEADVLGTWSTFLEDTWDMQSSCTKEKDDDTLHALSGLKLQFLQTLDANLPYLQRELHLLLDELKSCSQSLKDLAERESIENEEEILNRRVTFETRFFEAEGQIISILRTADVLKEEMLSFTVVENRQTLDIEEKIAKAFSSIDQLRKEMEGIERPAKSNQEELKSQEASLKSKTPLQVAVPSSDKEAMQPEDFFEEEARREMLERGPNAENKGTENAYVGSQDETEGWDFDEIEEELKS